MTPSILRNIFERSRLILNPGPFSQSFQKSVLKNIITFERLAILVASVGYLGLFGVTFFAQDVTKNFTTLIIFQILVTVSLAGFFLIVKPQKKQFVFAYYSLFYVSIILLISHSPEIVGTPQSDSLREEIFLLHIMVLLIQTIRVGYFPGAIVILFLFCHAAFIAFNDESFVWNFTHDLRLYFFILSSILSLCIEIILYSSLIKYLELLTQREKSQQELALAQKVHSNLFPSFKEDKNIRLSVYRAPENKTGGDYYDLIKLREGNLGFFCTDISGHGISSAMMSAALKVMLLEMPYQYRLRPEVLLSHMDRIIYEEYESHHASAVYLYFDFLKMKTRIANAGHPPILYSKKKGKFQELKTIGSLIGWKISDPPAKEINFPINRGDRFLIYTDGLLEFNTQNDDFPDIDIMELINGLEIYENQNIVENLVKKAQSHPEFNGFRDDVLIILLEVK